MIFDGLKFAKDALVSLRYLAINRKTPVTLSEHNELHRAIISDFHTNISTILQLANLLVSTLKAQNTYYFMSQIDLIEAYASTFTGREDVLNSFRNFREQHVNGGIFLIIGAPGEGKSALAAKIIKERQSEAEWLYLFAAARIVHAQGKLAEAGTLLAEVEPHLAALGPEQIAEFYFLKAETLRESGAYAEARTAYETCRDMLQSQENKSLLLDTLLHLGDLEYVRGELSAAMQTLSEALSLSETLHLQLFVGQSHRLIGQIFYIQEKYREALKHYHKALDIFTLLDNQAYLGRIYMNLAETYVPIDLDKALSFAEAAIKLDTQLDFGLELGKALFTRADIARIQKRFADCTRDVQASIDQFLSVGHISGLARAYRVQALLYLDQRQFENALRALDQSDESFAKIQVYPTFVLKNMITRLEIYSGMGELQQAEETRSRLIEMGKASELGYLVDKYFSSSPLSSLNGENA